MIRFIMAFGIGVLAIGGEARAQTEDAPKRTARRFFDTNEGISLEQAVARAREHEASLRALRTSVDAAQGARLQAGLRPNPAVSVEHRHEPGGTDRQTMVSVQVPLDLFRRAGRTAVAERELEAVRLEVDDRERLLASEVRQRYGDLLVAVRELAVSDEVVAAIGQEHGLVSARVEQGASPPLDRDRVEVELRRTEAERLLIAARAEAALLELKRLLGFEPHEKLTVSDTLERVVERDRGNEMGRLPPPLATTFRASSGETSPEPLAKAGKAAPAYDVPRRPDVLQAAAGIRVADARLDRARREGRFDVSLFGGYTRMDAGFPQLGFGGDGRLERVRGLFNYFAAGAMVTVPLRNRNQGEVAAATAARAGAAARYEAARLAAASELAAAVAGNAYALQAVTLFTDGARTLAHRNLVVIRQSYALGRATVVDVVAEQRRYLETERAYTEALREAYQARTALDRAMGGVQ